MILDNIPIEMLRLEERSYIQKKQKLTDTRYGDHVVDVCTNLRTCFLECRHVSRLLDLN